MGSGRDKRKKANPGKPGAGREKTERKTAAAEAKRERRETRDGADEDDIDALLARVRLADAASAGGAARVEEGVAPPSRRVNASLTAVPAGPRPGELLLYGGEWYDNAKTRVYGELFRFDAQRRRWAQVHAPGAPPPRSAHQAVAWKQWLFVFGGEFTSPNQARHARGAARLGAARSGQQTARVDALSADTARGGADVARQERFLHYKDLWRLDLATWRWEQLTLRGGPSARRAPATPRVRRLRASRADSARCPAA
jgi:hypothetical protein